MVLYDCSHYHYLSLDVHSHLYLLCSGADLGFIKGGGGGLTQGINLLGRGVRSTFPSMLELGGSGGMPPPRKILKNRC